MGNKILVIILIFVSTQILQNQFDRKSPVLPKDKIDMQQVRNKQLVADSLNSVILKNREVLNKIMGVK